MRRSLMGLIAASALMAAIPSISFSLGLGVVAGEPTGVSFKQWLAGGNAVDGALAWSFDGPDAFAVHMDYLYHMTSAGDVRIPGWKFYLGIGGRLKLEEDDSRLGVRVPLGINYLFRSSPFDFFMEMGPIMDLAPATEFTMSFGVGIRYFFGQPWKTDILK
ncbi:MAG: hypothetical protein PVF95_04320 [bacterium]|jgi:hypothetical protein